MKTNFFSLDENTSNTINKATDILKNNGIIAFPTDTIYGLLAKYSDDNAKKLHKIKEREITKPFLILINSEYSYKSLIDESKLMACADAYIEYHWPGNITMILPKNKELLYPAGDTIAIRMPKKDDNLYLYELLKKVDFPILAPSANISGDVAINNGEDIYTCFKDKIEAVFDLKNYKQRSSSEIWDICKFPFEKIR
ncbi:MAG: L-threonylcarbamoyladenylate synthase [Spirochaetia bacterium]|nr:L-threonylcarbamoyladenylate synthase [Spirochaetia bacterium]